MKKGSVGFLVLAGWAVVSANAWAADECLDGRVARIRCKPNQVLTHYGCNDSQDFLVHCQAVADLPLVEVKSSQVFPRIVTSGIRITRAGEVVQFRLVGREGDSGDGASVKRKLSEYDLGTIQALAQSLDPAELDRDAVRPPVMDAASVRYRAVQDSGRVIEFASAPADLDSHVRLLEGPEDNRLHARVLRAIVKSIRAEK